ncbi:protein lin-41-like [Anneissia japonica]|uniref:protein lin-41-like n=1 Tax=Anneissia japonica TaxID=1529436 RepID=UPI001425846F|nr:protein lin-41-like [Anneissia japonica]
MDVVADVHQSFEEICRKKPKRASASSVTIEEGDRVSTIVKQGMKPSDVVMSEDGCLLVSDWSNEILIYKQSGEHVRSVKLPSGVKVRTLYKMKNNDLIVFADFGNRCITLCKLDGDVIKSIGKGILSNPFGIYVDENLNVVYVADFDKHCVFKFNIDADQLIKKIGSEGHNEGELNRPWDVTVTSEGHLIVADCWNHRLQLFDSEGRFMKILVGQGDQDGSVIYPQAVIIDKDDNMLVTSRHKLQVFNSSGQFIKRIDEDKDGLDCPYRLSIVSYNPRRIVVANRGGRNIKIFNES